MELAERQVTANKLEPCPLKSLVGSICLLSGFSIQGLSNEEALGSVFNHMSDVLNVSAKKLLILSVFYVIWLMSEAFLEVNKFIIYYYF